MTLVFCKIRGYFKAGDGEVKGSVGRRSWCRLGTAWLCLEERALLCCLLAQLPCWAVDGNKCSQNLIVSSCELVSPLSHLIPTFAYWECRFNAAFLDFITFRLSTASERAFWTAQGLFCRAGGRTSLPFFSPELLDSPWLQWLWQGWLTGVGWGSCLQAGAAAGWCWGCWGGAGRQQLVGKPGMWPSGTSDWPWTNLQLGCNPAWRPARPGLCCFFLEGKWSVTVLLLV